MDEWVDEHHCYVDCPRCITLDARSSLDDHVCIDVRAVGTWVRIDFRGGLRVVSTATSSEPLWWRCDRSIALMQLMMRVRERFVQWYLPLRERTLMTIVFE